MRRTVRTDHLTDRRQATCTLSTMTITVITQAAAIATIVAAVSALGSLGAVTMAVTVYRRQANDKRRQRASRVLTFADPSDDKMQIQWQLRTLAIFRSTR